MKKQYFQIFTLTLVLFVLSYLLGSMVLTGADILGFDSGGSGNISINPNENSGNPFGDPGIVPGVPPADEGGGDEGGGAGGGVSVTVGNLTVTPVRFDITMLISTNLQSRITLTNIGTTSQTVSLSQTGLDSMIIIENSSISLAAGETKIANIIFVAPAIEGVYNGTIHVGEIDLPVVMTVLEEFILFDSNIVVLNDDYQVPQGDALQTEVTMIPMGGPVRMDVTLNYVIKDINGTTFLTKSETLLVEAQKSIRRDFDTGGLPLGKYIIELELIYPFGVAPSSAYFDIVESTETLFSLVAYWIMFMIIIILIILIILTIIRTIRKIQVNRVISSEPVVSVY